MLPTTPTCTTLEYSHGLIRPSVEDESKTPMLPTQWEQPHVPLHCNPQPMYPSQSNRAHTPVSMVCGELRTAQLS